MRPSKIRLDQDLNLESLGSKSPTGDDIQIFGEELFILLRRIHRQYVAFLFYFFPPVELEPRTSGLTAPRIFKMCRFYQEKFIKMYSYNMQKLHVMQVFLLNPSWTAIPSDSERSTR